MAGHDSHHWLEEGERAAEIRARELWESASEPLLVVALRVLHAVTSAREELELVIARGGVSLRFRERHPLRAIEREELRTLEEDPEELAAHLRAMGILELGPASEPMIDGAEAEVAACADGRVHSFRERSLKSPQAALRETLLALAHDTEPDLPPEEDGDGRECFGSESVMPFDRVEPEEDSAER